MKFLVNSGKKGKMSRRKTIYLKKALTELESMSLYQELCTLPCTEGIRSKNGFTRLAYSLELEDNLGAKILTIVKDVLLMMKTQDEKMPNYAVYGTYINYYKDGNMYTPNHTHPGTHQLVISLGVSRNLLLGKKVFVMESGDAVLFGSSVHGVPKQPEIKEGRISIATFMKPI